MSISKDDLVDVYKCNVQSCVTIEYSFSIIRILFNPGHILHKKQSIHMMDVYVQKEKTPRNMKIIVI